MVAPLLLFAVNYRLLNGTMTVTSDTGDGLGSFRFFQLPLPYWNWFESLGQPYWTEMAVYRLQDPLMWPFVLLAKTLSHDLIIQFNTYNLLRVSLLSVLIFFLFRELLKSRFAVQLATLTATLGSTASIALYSIGILDLLSAFVGMALFGLLYLRTEKKAFLLPLTLVGLHASITYHVLYLLPLFLGLLLAKERTHVWKLMKRDWHYFVASALLISSALVAEWLAVSDPHLVPLLRSAYYNSEVDSSGRIINGVGEGRSIFDKNSLKTPAEDCGHLYYCSPHSLSNLKTFFYQDIYWSRTGFVTVTGLFFVLLTLRLWRSRRVRIAWGLVLLCFALSLGHLMPFWPLAQKLLLPLQYLRHTGFYVPLYTLLLCLLIGIGIERYARFRMALALIVVMELMVFNRFQLGRLFDFTKAGQRAELNAPAANTYSFRKWRLLNPYHAPRASMGTALGIPTVLESLFVQDMEVTDSHLERSQNPRYFGNINLFQSRAVTEARVSMPREVFAEAAGAFPYPILSSQGNAYPVRFLRDAVEATVEVKSPQSFYAAFPFSIVSGVFLDGKALTFLSAKGFGVAFDIPQGTHSVRIVPVLTRRNAIYGFYYGAYLGLGLWAVLATCLHVYQVLRASPYTKSLRVPKPLVSPLQH